MKTFPFYRQYDQMDCGPTCLRMIAKHHGRHYSMDSLRQKSGINREGVSLLGISEAAEEIGFRTVGAKLTWEQLKKEAALPCVIYWNQVHFVVVYKIKGDKVYIADPAKGKVIYRKEEFLEQWLVKNSVPVNVAVSDKEAEEYSRVHYSWIKQAGITKTPTTFMNGYELPVAYRVKDLAALIPGLVDAFGNQNERINTEVIVKEEKMSER